MRHLQKAILDHFVLMAHFGALILLIRLYKSLLPHSLLTEAYVEHVFKCSQSHTQSPLDSSVCPHNIYRLLTHCSVYPCFLYLVGSLSPFARM